MDINSDNDDSKDNNIDSISHNNNNITHANDDTSSHHIYALSPIECFLINKHLPFPFKLEHEDVYKAYLCKKQKQNEMISTYNSCNTNNVSVNNNNNNNVNGGNGVCGIGENKKRKMKRKRKRKRDIEIDNESFDLSEQSNNNNYHYYYAHKKFPPLNRKVTKKTKISNQLKCEKVMYKLQRIPISKHFFTACSVDNYLISRNMLPKKKGNKNRKTIYNTNNNNGNGGSNNSGSVFHYLKKIYMKVQNKEYETIYHFGNDLRRTWDGLFRLYANNPKLYTKIYKLSEKCEGWMNRMEGVSYSKLKKDDEPSSEDELYDVLSNNSCYCKEVNGGYTGGVNVNDYLHNTHNKFITYNVVDAAAEHQQQQFMYNKSHNYNNSNMLFQTKTYYQPQQRTSLTSNDKPKQQRYPAHAITQEEMDFILSGINHLTKNQLCDILKIIDKNVKQNNTNIYEFDIEDLEISKQRELYNYVNQCLYINQQHNTITNINNINNIQRDITTTQDRRNTERERLTDIDKVEQLKKDLGFYHLHKYSTEIDNTNNLPQYNSYINNINNNNSYI